MCGRNLQSILECWSVVISIDSASSPDFSFSSVHKEGDNIEKQRRKETNSDSKCKCHKNCGFLSAPIIPTFFSMVCFAFSFISFIKTDIYTHTRRTHSGKWDGASWSRPGACWCWFVCCLFFFRVFWNFSTVTYRRENNSIKILLFHHPRPNLDARREIFSISDNKNCCLPQSSTGAEKAGRWKTRPEWIRPWWSQSMVNMAVSCDDCGANAHCRCPAKTRFHLHPHRLRLAIQQKWNISMFSSVNLGSAGVLERLECLPRCPAEKVQRCAFFTFPVFKFDLTLIAFHAVPTRWGRHTASLVRSFWKLIMQKTVQPPADTSAATFLSRAILRCDRRLSGTAKTDFAATLMTTIRYIIAFLRDY